MSPKPSTKAARDAGDKPNKRPAGRLDHQFDVLADHDVDGAVFQFGIQHYPLGPARPALRINTGAVEIAFNVHHTDIDTLIEACKAARRYFRKAGLA